jgi:hypothetical protein
LAATIYAAGAGDLEALAESMTLERGVRSRQTWYHFSLAGVYRTLVQLGAPSRRYLREIKALSLDAARGRQTVRQPFPVLAWVESGTIFFSPGS